MPTYKLRTTEGDTFLDQLLHSRGLKNSEDKQVFLNPEYNSGTHDPFLLKDMDRTVERIKRAVDANEKITIYSDFDADGIPGAVVLHDCLKKIGHTNFANYIPHRHREGFGIHKAALDEIAKAGSTLVISIDCGIADIESAKYAKELGIDLIITDHHTPGDVLPDAYALINPKRPDCQYPEKMLCGAGVIYKVAQALARTFNVPEGYEKWWLDMVGLATLSDMVPLLGENRIFAHFGLIVMRKARRVGLQKLFKSVKIDPRYLTEEDIAFMVTPRINAASRMADPIDAFKLLSTTDELEADMMTEHLNTINNNRKVQVAHLVKDIKKKIDERDISDKPVIVLGDIGWNPPVLGLAATHIVRDYNKPTFLWGKSEEGEEGVFKGSCRAPAGMDVVKIMRAMPADYFLNAGGHSASGGFSIAEDKIHFFEKLALEADLKLKGGVGAMDTDGVDPAMAENSKENQDILWIDKYAEPADVGFKVWSTIEKVAPFGEANPKPVFMFKKVIIDAINLFGKKKEHAELVLKGKGSVKAIKFFAEDDKIFMSKIAEGKKVDVVAHMEKSMFKRYPEYRLRIIDIL